MNLRLQFLPTLKGWVSLEGFYDNDKVYRIKINGVNQPTFDDLCEAIYYLLKNKVFDHAFLHYKDKVLDAINRAEVERKKEKISENNHSDLLSDYF